MKKSTVVIILLALIAFIFFTDFHGLGFTEEGAIHSNGSYLKNTKITKSVSSHNGKAVMFEDKELGVVGYAWLTRRFGLIWKNSAMDWDEITEKDMPFKSQSYIVSPGTGKQILVTYVKVIDPSIKYIALGEKEEIQKWDKENSITLEEVKENPELFRYEEVTDGSVLYVIDSLSGSWLVVSAFDSEGRLVGGKLPGETAKYVE